MLYLVRDADSRPGIARKFYDQWYAQELVVPLGVEGPAVLEKLLTVVAGENDQAVVIEIVSS